LTASSSLEVKGGPTRDRDFFGLTVLLFAELLIQDLIHTQGFECGVLEKGSSETTGLDKG
jgi:hypothetical protein